MSPGRWQEIERLYHSARDCAPGEREALFAQADPEVRRKVELMLAEDGTGDKILDARATDLLTDLTQTRMTPGSQLGPYKIEGLLGAGGMGEVFRGIDTRLGRRVAIKTTRQQFAQRFNREGRAISSLNHPHICTLYDVGPNYLVMELCEGETLAARLKRGKLSIEDTIRYGAQIADALAAAHTKGIVHRDLKPQNIMLTKAGVKVLDFGLAKSTRDETLTVANVVMGTPAYMAPEQREGKETDTRTDIYALGLVLCEMATGQRAVHGQPAPLNGLSPQFSHVAGRCLEQDPDNRWQTASDLKAELEWAAAGDFVAHPAAVSRRAFYPWTAGVIAMVAAALAWIHFREIAPALPNLRYQLTRPGDSGFAQFQISPDGRHLAFVDRSGANRLYVRALDSLEDRGFPGTDGTTYPFWSPDSSHIAFFSQGKLKQVALGGGPATNIADAPDGRGGTWGRGGSIVFAPGVTGTLFRVSASGGAATRLDLPRAGSGEGDSLRFPEFLPDSDRFFYTIEARTPEGYGVYVGSLNGDPPVRILADFSLTRFVRSPGSNSAGYILFCRQTTLMAQAFDPSGLKIGGEAFPLAEEVQQASGNSGFAEFTVSSNGVLIYAGDGNTSQEREIVWLDRGGKHGKSILKQKGITDFALSPDKTRLLYSLAAEYVSGDLWLRDIASGASQRFTFRPFSAYSPVWSPDGATAVFTAFPEDQLYVIKMASSAKEEALHVSGTDTYASSWSADGKLLAFSQHGVTTKDDLWLLPMDGERKPRLFRGTPYNERNPQISPDGRWIVYSSDPSGRMEIYIEPIAGGAPLQMSVEGGTNPQWRADGRELYFLSDHKLMAVDVTSSPGLTFKPPHELFHDPRLAPMIAKSVVSREITYQPKADGSQFLMLLSVGDASAEPPLTVVTNWQTAMHK